MRYQIQQRRATDRWRTVTVRMVVGSGAGMRRLLRAGPGMRVVAGAAGSDMPSAVVASGVDGRPSPIWTCLSERLDHVSLKHKLIDLESESIDRPQPRRHITTRTQAATAPILTLDLLEVIVLGYGPASTCCSCRGGSHRPKDPRTQHRTCTALLPPIFGFRRGCMQTDSHVRSTPPNLQAPAAEGRRRACCRSTCRLAFAARVRRAGIDIERRLVGYIHSTSTQRLQQQPQQNRVRASSIEPSRGDRTGQDIARMIPYPVAGFIGAVIATKVRPCVV